ncbi:hypothetical protein MMC16_007227 [Acarospora aff. strigata]|nr:hypothetical protein [Acarospora aff. strigata]
MIQLAFCQQIALGTPKRNPMDGYIASRQLKALSSRAEYLDKEYHVLLPNMPQEIISFLQDHRADQYDVGEISDALITIFQEVQGKINSCRPLRSTQVLYTTLGRLFSLIGRHEEAEICYRNALNHLPPLNWRTESFGDRMREASQSAADKRRMRKAQARVQLEEAEHNLFAFSLVQSLEIQGKVKDAVQVLLKIKSIAAAPNGLYVRRETGGEALVAHRIIVARNLLIGLLIGQSKLDEVRAMGQHMDLRDVLEFCKPWDSRIVGCFEISENMSTALITQGRYRDAAKLQRDRLTTCLELLPGDKKRIRSATRDLAISLSHQDDDLAIEEAYRLQRQLIDEQDESYPEIGPIKLNYAFTIARLGKVDEALALSQASQRQQQPTAKDQVFFNFSPGLCSYGLEESEAPVQLQEALLDICRRVCNKDSQLALISLVFTRSWQSVLSEGSEDLITLIRDILNAHADLILPADQHILWHYLLLIVLSRGLDSEDVEQFGEAIKLSNEMYNEMSMISNEPIVITKADCLMASVHLKRAFFLYHVRGIGQADLSVLKECIVLHRRALRMCTQTMGSGDCNTLAAKENLARNLFDHGATLHHKAEVAEAIELYKEILLGPGLDVSASLHLETDLHYAQTVLDQILGQEVRNENYIVQRADMERIREYFGEDHLYTRLQQNRVAELCQQRGQVKVKEALELLEKSSNACESARGEKHPETLRARMAVVLLRQKTGAHHYEILPELSRVRHQAARVFGSPGHTSALDYLSRYASALIHDPMAMEEAVSLKRQVLDVFIDIFGRCHTKTISAMGELGSMLSRCGGQDYRDGIRLFEESLDLSVSLLGILHPLTGTQWTNLLSEQHAQLNTYNEKLTKRVEYELRDFRYHGGPLTSEHELRDRWLDPRVVTEGIRVVWSIQLLPRSHTFIVEASRRFVECLCRPEIWHLKED